MSTIFKIGNFLNTTESWLINSSVQEKIETVIAERTSWTESKDF